MQPQTYCADDLIPSGCYEVCWTQLLDADWTTRVILPARYGIWRPATVVKRVSITLANRSIAACSKANHDASCAIWIPSREPMKPGCRSEYSDRYRLLTMSVLITRWALNVGLCFDNPFITCPIIVLALVRMMLVLGDIWCAPTSDDVCSTFATSSLEH